MTKKQVAKSEPNLIKLSKKADYVAVPEEALKELFDFATAFAAADDKVLNARSKGLASALSRIDPHVQ